MKCKVVKRFYDPLRKRYVAVGEEIKVKEKDIKGYKPYVTIIAKPKPKKKPTKKAGD